METRKMNLSSPTYISSITPPPALLRTTNLVKTYGKKPEEFTALNNVSLSIQEGECLALLGKSGSGKTTLMHLMATLDSPTSGEIWFGNQDIAHFSAKQLAQVCNESFGFIFQQFFLLPRLNVLENVMLPLKIRGISRKQAELSAHQALEIVGLRDKARNKATDLSGGQKQRVAIARALVGKPKVLFADEPTGNLDTATGKQVMDFLFQMQKEQGLTLIVVTHDPDLAQRFYRHVILVDGQIV